MELYINGEKDTLDVPSAKTIGDVLREFETECEKQDGAVIGITIDGEDITADTFDSTLEKPLSPDTKFDFTVVSKIGTIEALHKLSPTFENLATAMRGIGATLQSGDKQQTAKDITSFADNMNELCHWVKMLSLFGDYSKVLVVDGVPFDKFIAEMNSVLVDLKSAWESDDSVTIGDLSEYEISDRLLALSKTLGGVQ